MRRIAWAVGLAAVATWAGCSRPDPLSSRLEPGSEAMIRRPPPANEESERWHPRAVIVCNLATEPTPVVEGTKVRVVADSEPASPHRGMTFNKDIDGLVDRRRVTVLVIEGDSRGHSGWVDRNQLVPIR